MRFTRGKALLRGQGEVQTCQSSRDWLENKTLQERTGFWAQTFKQRAGEDSLPFFLPLTHQVRVPEHSRDLAGSGPTRALFLLLPLACLVRSRLAPREGPGCITLGTGASQGVAREMLWLPATQVLDCASSLALRSTHRCMGWRPCQLLQCEQPGMGVP